MSSRYLFSACKNIQTTVNTEKELTFVTHPVTHFEKDIHWNAYNNFENRS